MKNIFLSFILICFYVTNITAQSFKLPKDVKLENKEDYKKYEKEILGAIDWLMNTPLSKETKKRKEVNAFFMQWISGAPDVTIELQTEFIDYGDCVQCLMIFMGGWTQYTLKTGESLMIKGNVEGVRAVIDFYKKNEDEIGKNKGIKKFMKLEEKGELEEYVKSTLSKS